jgi:hypothetical protein
MAQQAPTEHLPTQIAHELRGHEGAVLNVRNNPAGTYCISCGKVSYLYGLLSCLAALAGGSAHSCYERQLLNQVILKGVHLVMPANHSLLTAQNEA